MYRLIKKNFNIFLLLFLFNISYLGLKDFTSMESNLILETGLIREEKKDVFAKNNDTTNKFLVKKKLKDSIEKQDKDFKVAHYSTSDFFSDYSLNEIDLNLSLVPVSEKILFSGIPIPKSKPLPLIQNFSKHFSYSVKSKKELSTILETNKFDLYEKKKNLQPHRS